MIITNIGTTQVDRLNVMRLYMVGLYKLKRKWCMTDGIIANGYGHRGQFIFEYDKIPGERLGKIRVQNYVLIYVYFFLSRLYFK